MRSFLLATCIVALAACGSGRSATAERSDTPAPNYGTHTYPLSSDEDFSRVFEYTMRRRPDKYLEIGVLVRVCKPGAFGTQLDCRFIVPTAAAANVVTVYIRGGMRAFLDRGPLNRGRMTRTLNRGVNFQVCDMPLVTDPDRPPPCEIVRSSPT